MTAQSRYISSILVSFSSFLENERVSPHHSDEAVVALTAFLAHKQTLTNWSISELARFFNHAPAAAEWSEAARSVVMQFVDKYPPFQTTVFLHEYLLALRADNCSSSTIKNYRSDISQFFDFCQTTIISEAVEKPKLEKFVAAQAQKGLKETSIRRKLSSIVQFALWLQAEGMLVSTTELESVSANLDSYLKNAPAALPDTKQTVVKSALVPSRITPTRLAAPSGTGLQSRQDVRSRLKANFGALQNRLQPLQKSPLLPYLNLAMGALFAITLGFFGYRQFIADVETPFAYPASPTRPNRVLQFQGRLTDTNQNPVTTSTDMAFRLYDANTAGNLLWNSGTCSIVPDQDGIFNADLGSACGAEIDQEVFSENSNVWLEVQIESETLDPRQSIKTVPYALNSETLQGYPIDATGAATMSTVVTMNNLGEVVFGEVSPKLRSVSGNFAIEAETLTLQTSAGSDGDIVLSPDGVGDILANADVLVDGYIAAAGATISATYADSVVLSLTAVSGATGNIIDWVDANSSGGGINAAGNLGIGTNNPAYKLEISAGEAIAAAFDGRVIGIDAVNSDEFVTKSQLDALSTGSGLWTDGGAITYLTSATDDVTIGGSTTGAPFFFDTSAGRLTLNTDGSGGGLVLGTDTQLYRNGANFLRTPDSLVVDGNVGIGTTAPIAGLHIAKWSDTVPALKFGNATYGWQFYERNTDGDLQIKREEAGISYDVMYFKRNSGNVGIGSTAPGATLDVVGTGRFSSTLTASNGLTLTTGALNLTGTSGALTLSGLSASSISTGANNLTFTSANFNTTATGINTTAIGATTRSTGAFTTLAANGVVTLTGVSTGTDNTVLVLNASNEVIQDEIDSRVWGTTLIDGSGTTNYVARFSDADTVTTGVIYDDGTNVGIGTTSPGAKLTSVVSSAATSAFNTAAAEGLRLQNSDNTNNNWTELSFYSQTNTVAGGLGFQVSDHTNSYGSLAFFTRGSGGWGERMRISEAGNVGIGSATPSQLLDVAGAIRLGAASANNVLNTTVGGGAPSNSLFWGSRELCDDTGNCGTTGMPAGTSGQTLRHDGADWVANSLLYNNGTNVGIGTTGTGNRLTLKSAGASTSTLGLVESSGTDLLIELRQSAASEGEIFVNDTLGSVSASFFSGGGNGNMYLYNSGALRIALSADNTVDSYFNTGKNLGIGTATPGYTLDVNGELNLTDAIRVAGDAGTSGYLLTSSAGGAMTWTDPASLAAAVEWNDIIDPTGNQALAMAANTTTWTWNGLTTGTGLTASSNSLSSGSLASLAVTGTAAASNTQKVLNLSTSGANGTSTQTTYGLYSTNTHTGTSSTNVAGYFSASGGSNNYAAIFEAGNVGIGTTTPTSITEIVHTSGADLFLSRNDTTVTAEDTLGSLSFKSYDTSTNGTKVKAYIRGVAETTFTGGDHLSKLEFGTAIGTDTPLTKMTLSSAGHLGIGTAAPTSMLHVNGTTSGQPLVLLKQTGSENIIVARNSTDTDRMILADTGYLSAERFVDISNSAYYLDPAAVSTSMAVAGNVGIGTSSPGARTEITGNFDFSSALWNNAQLRISRTADSADRLNIGYTDQDYAVIQAGTEGVAYRDLILNPNGANVGIGTTVPIQKLAITGTSTAGITSQTNISAFAANGIRLNGTSANAQDAIGYQSGSGGGGAAIAFGRGGSWDTFMDFYVNSTAGSSGGSIDTHAVRINSTGNIGIGTTTANVKLEVNGAIRVPNDTGVYFGTTNATILHNYQYTGPELWVHNGTAAASQGIVLGTGFDSDLTVRTVYTPGTVGAGAGVLQIGQNAKNHSNYTHGVTSFLTNGIERMRINVDGNMGIGTTAPAFKLDVDGTFQADTPIRKTDYWSTLADAPGTMNDDMSALVYGGDGYIYALRGGGTTTFYRYSISANTWSTMTATPGTMGGYGATLVYTGGDYIYALRGESSSSFYRYSISGNSWTTLTGPSVSVDYGASMAYAGGDYIYASLGDASATPYRYSISGDSWSTLTDITLGDFDYGAALAYTGGDYIYATLGGGSTALRRYSISSNTWSNMTNIPAGTNTGGGMVYTGGNYLYVTTGNATSTMYRYSINTNTWTAVSNTPATLTTGSSLAYDGYGNIYALRGGNTATFYRYAAGGDNFFSLKNLGADLHGYNPQRDIVLVDEFVSGLLTTGNIGDLGWSLVNGTTLGLAPASSEDAIGILRLRTLASASRGALMLSSGAVANRILHTDSGVNTHITMRIATPTSNADFDQRIGLLDTTNAGPTTNGLFFRATGTGNWFAVNRSASVETGTATDCSVAQSATFQTFEILINADSSSIVYKINGTVCATHTANIPANTVILSPTFKVDTSGATIREMEIDRFVLTQSPLMTGADLAEFYHTSDATIGAGDIVAADPSKAENVLKADTLTNPNMLGIVSSQPGKVLGNSEGDGLPVIVGLAGRVPVKVTTANGSINAGDYIAISEIPGVGVKAVTAGQVVGMALESYENEDPSAISTVLVLIKNTWHEPSPELEAQPEDVQLLESLENGFELITSSGSVVTKVATFAQSTIANLTAGLITTRDLVVQNTASIANLSVNSLTVQGQALPDYIASVFFQLQNNAPQDPDALVSPITSVESLNVTELSAQTSQLGMLLAQDATISGTLVAENVTTHELVATTTSLGSLLVAGDATVSGTASVETLVANEVRATSSRIEQLEAKMAAAERLTAIAAEFENATVSGTLYANSIDGLDDKIYTATAQHKSSLLDILTGTDSVEDIDDVIAVVDSAGLTATQSADLALTLAELQLTASNVALSLDALFVDQYFRVNGGAYVAGSMGVGNSIFAENTVSAGQQVTIANTLTVGPSFIAYSGSDTFEIQPSGTGSLSLMAGLLKLEENGTATLNGDFTIAGNTTVEGTLFANLLRSTELGNPLQVQVAGISDTNEVKKSRFEIIDELGTPVATISAEGRATFAGGLGVGSENLGTANTDNLDDNDRPLLQSNKTSGKATIPSGTAEITIRSNKIGPDSLIYVTPVGSTNNKVLFVKSQQAEQPSENRQGEFVLGFDEAVDSDVQLNWWIVN